MLMKGKQEAADADLKPGPHPNLLICAAAGAVQQWGPAEALGQADHKRAEGNSPQIEPQADANVNPRPQTLNPLFVLQLELYSNEDLQKHWVRLTKREKKAADANPDHVPGAHRPDARFLPNLLDEFIQVCTCCCI